MFQLSSKVTIISEKTWSFSKITSCEIERDIEKVTATCTLVLPKKTKWHNETAIPVKRGDKITVELGYDGNLEPVFSGYIKRVSAKTPVEIMCEDEMFTLKQVACKKKTYAAANLKELLFDQLPEGMKFETFAEQSFGQFTVNSDTVAQLLGGLAEQGISSYFVGDTLYCGMIHNHESQITGMKQKFFSGENGNIIDDGDLVWNAADDINLRIKAEGTDAQGNRISVEVGDKEGELRSYFKYNTTLQELEAEATGKLTEWKVSGLSGSFTTFGAKTAGLLDRIKIETPEAPSAVYRVVKNGVSYGTDGYRQDISIGGKM
jgi:hypothetical protein